MTKRLLGLTLSLMLLPTLASAYDPDVKTKAGKVQTQKAKGLRAPDPAKPACKAAADTCTQAADCCSGVCDAASGKCS